MRGYLEFVPTWFPAMFRDEAAHSSERPEPSHPPEHAPSGSEKFTVRLLLRGVSSNTVVTVQ